MSIVVVIPSRGRPQRAHEAIAALRSTARLVSTSVVLVVDVDDQELPAYLGLRWTGDFGPEVTRVVLSGSETGDLVRATNTVSMRIATDDPSVIIGNLGDDHLCRTPGWDVLVETALMTPGVAYGDDLLQGEALPTAPFVSASIVLALGYYFLPDLEHMFVDNVVRDIGAQTGTLRYCPDVVIEHMHPLVRKADWDDGYIAVNSDAAISRDKLRYESWRIHAMAVDVGRVRSALEQAA